MEDLPAAAPGTSVGVSLVVCCLCLYLGKLPSNMLLYGTLQSTDVHLSRHFRALPIHSILQDKRARKIYWIPICLLLAENTIQSQMHLNRTTQEGQAELSYTPSQSIHGRSTSTSLASGMIQV